MARCTFCGVTMEKGTGKMFVYKSGKIDYFCSGKCEKNLLNLNRKARKLKWTSFYEKTAKKEETEK
ncbi:MAG: 50S ribosomal protein L24e [Candidatus Nanoarchaeia archaeon]|nr:50S ribosomal protein L24e [Candidatus Nanoarchaeia archaeon]